MIGNDQELRRVGERDVVGEHLRFDVPVHADQRQILRLAVDFPGDASLLCRKRQSPVRVELEGRSSSRRSTPRSRSVILTARPVRNDSLPAMPDRDCSDPGQPIRWSFQPVIARPAEDIGEQQRVASAMSSGALFDLDVLGHLPVAL